MGRKAIDLTGQTFGEWIVIERAKRKSKSAYWLCKCSCGTVNEIESQKLTKGRSKSCGCKRNELISKANTKHGMTNTRIFSIWHTMITRCKYDDGSSRRYFGRGITVCNEWLDFENFYDWAIDNGYKENLTIDRIDNDGNYEPSNCRWLTIKQQCNNKSNNKHIEINGISKTVSEWSDVSGVKYETIRSRVKRGVTGKRLLAKPWEVKS